MHEKKTLPGILFRVDRRGSERERERARERERVGGPSIEINNY